MSGPTITAQPTFTAVYDAVSIGTISFSVNSTVGVTYTLQKRTDASGGDASGAYVDVSGASFEVSGTRVSVNIPYAQGSLIKTVVFRIKATNISGSTTSNTVSITPPTSPSITVLHNFASYSKDDTKALFDNPPASLKQQLTTGDLDANDIELLGMSLVDLYGTASIVIDGVKIHFPVADNNGVYRVNLTAGSNKIRIPVGISMSDKYTITTAGTTIQYMGLNGSTHQFKISEPGKDEVTVDDGDEIIIEGNKELTITWGSININLANANVNSFPVAVNPYLAVDNVLIYTKATVDALVATNGAGPVPATPRVAWAPLGVTAGSLMRALERVVVVADAEGRHLQRWVRVQYVNGAGSEGVDDTLADYGCGWICVWDASGFAPSY